MGDAKLTNYARVRDALRRDILSGRLAPGERLVVAALVERYGCSAMPIRAALQELHGQGLLTATPHHGARVRMVDADFVANICDLRKAVLGVLLPRTVKFITNADIEEIEAIQTRLETAATTEGPAKVMRHNHDFHHLIYRIARNPEALDVMERTWVLVDALRLRLGFGRGRLTEANLSHRRLIESLEKRDAAAASTIAQESVERAKQDLIACLEEEQFQQNGRSQLLGSGRL